MNISYKEYIPHNWSVCPNSYQLLVPIEHRYRSKYSLEEHISVRSWWSFVIAFCKDLRAGRKFLEFCWMKCPWALQSSCNIKSPINFVKWILVNNSEGICRRLKQTWLHRRLNSRCGQLSKRSANASINLCRYLTGMEEATAGISEGFMAKIHFLIKEFSFRRRLSIKALCFWPSERATSTACTS